MTPCPFIPSIAYRLPRTHRPNTIVRSDPARRAKGVKPTRPGSNRQQTPRRTMETAVFNPHSHAPKAASDPTDCTLSP